MVIRTLAQREEVVEEGVAFEASFEGPRRKRIRRKLGKDLLSSLLVQKGSDDSAAALPRKIPFHAGCEDLPHRILPGFCAINAGLSNV